MKVLVTGGTGFIGPHIVRRLVDDGHQVRVLEREPGSLQRAGLPAQEAVQGDVTDAASLRRAVEGQEVVVHLVSIINGRPEQFKRVMSQGTRDLLAAAKEAGARRFVLMSALGTSEETKDLVPYYRAKWEMEQAVKGSGLEHVIFRPSFVFGRGGGALQQFLRIAKLSPVTPIVGPGTQRIQPIWLEDVAAYFAAAVDKPEAANRTFEIGGPDVVTWNEFWSRLKKAADARAGGGAGEAAESAGHARSVDDAGGGRQRRHERRRGRHLRPPARPARRATPQSHRQERIARVLGREAAPFRGLRAMGIRSCGCPSCANRKDEGPLARPFVFGTSLYWRDASYRSGANVPRAPYAG